MNEINLSLNCGLEAFYKKIRACEPSRDGLLFHYTDASGLVGIFSKKTLWASGADFLNDSSEPSYAIEVLKEVLGKLALEYEDGPETWLRNLWADYIKPTYEREGPHIYVFCLSEHDDTLSQWRAYGAQCAGYAVGFDAHSLKENLGMGQYLLKVVYSKEDQIKEASRNFKEILNIGFNTQQSCTEEIIKSIRSALFSEFIRLRAKFKHPAFQEEGEWRVVCFQPSLSSEIFGQAEAYPGAEADLEAEGLLKVKSRSSVSRIIPYVELNQPNLPIRKITYGAPLDTPTVEQSLRRLTNGYSHIDIKRSAIPYRS